MWFVWDLLRNCCSLQVFCLDFAMFVCVVLYRIYKDFRKKLMKQQIQIEKQHLDGKRAQAVVQQVVFGPQGGEPEEEGS